MSALIKSIALSLLCCSSAWAMVTPAEPTTAATPNATTVIATVAANHAATPIRSEQASAANSKPLTAEQIAKEKASNEAKMKAMVKDQSSRLQLLEKANLEALTQNQELQLKNDNLTVQVQVLQSESSAQMFLYGAATLAVGVLLGFLIASYIYTKRRRQW